MQAGEMNSSGLAQWLLFAFFLAVGIVLVVLFLRPSPFESPVQVDSKEVVLSEKRLAGDSAVSEKAGDVSSESHKKIVVSSAPLDPEPAKTLPLHNLGNQREAEPQKIPQVGKVKMYDLHGNEIASVPSLVLFGGLVALPRRACLGAVEWQFSPHSDRKASYVIDGVWSEGDEVGLWRIADNAQESVALAQWNSSMPIYWLSLQTGILISEVRMQVEMNQGDVVFLSVSEDLSEHGVFLQNGNVVGWTFGEWLGGGYLWNRAVPSEDELHSDVHMFYAATFAGGREEQFAKAILMDDETSASKRLKAFLLGIQLPAKLRREDTPERLYLENVLSDIRYLAQLIQHHGEAGELVSLVSAEVFSVAADIELLKITVAAIAKVSGYGKAVRFIENAKGYFLNEQDAGEISLVHLSLYKNWMKILLSERDIESGWLVFDRGTDIFPGDPELHLAGVELAVLEGDWQSAEAMLYQREYPAVFKQNIEILAIRISELKREEGSIVIRFPSGSTRIPVVAHVNGRKDIDFLVDTGATLVTVPVSLLGALGLEIDNDTPRRMVATAGGLQEAWEVNLTSVELGGWIVYNLKALAMDIPYHSQTGLLGLNFLEKFRMDLNTEKGILLLEPL